MMTKDAERLYFMAECVTYHAIEGYDFPRGESVADAAAQRFLSVFAESMADSDDDDDSDPGMASHWERFVAAARCDGAFLQALATHWREWRGQFGGEMSDVHGTDLHNQAARILRETWNG
jgi:hypothetical protein